MEREEEHVGDMGGFVRSKSTDCGIEYKDVDSSTD